MIVIRGATMKATIETKEAQQESS